MFPDLSPVALQVNDLWLPVVIGITMGLFSVLFLKYYGILRKIVKIILKKCHHGILIFVVFALTLVSGLGSFSFVSTGHELILQLLDNTYIVPLLIVLFVRTTLGLGANASGVTGGIFVPILALGALTSAGIAAVLSAIIDLSAEYSLLVLLLGICASVAGAMKMPLTAVTFAVEALSCQDNLLAVICVTITAFAVAELFGARSINEQVLEGKLQDIYTDKRFEVHSEFLTVAPNSFAEGKQVRDILWPANLMILSVSHKSKPRTEAGQVKDIVLSADDVIHIQYSAFDKKEIRAQLASILEA